MKQAFIICLAFFLNACSSTPLYIAAPELSQTNAATLIVYTPNTEFNRQNFIKPTLTIDGLTLTELSINTPINVLIHKGNHIISFERGIPFLPNYEAGKIEFTALANKIYYIRYSYDFDDKPVKPGEQATSSGASSFRLVTQTTGEALQ